MDDVLYIGMGELAYLDRGLVDQKGYDAIETPGIDSCFGIGLYDSESGDVALLHADRSIPDQIKEAVHVLDREIDAEFDTVELWTSETGYEMDVGTYEGASWRKSEAGVLAEKIVSENVSENVKTHMMDETVSIGVKYGEGIYRSEIETAERLDGPLGIANRQTVDSGELVVDVLEKESSSSV